MSTALLANVNTNELKSKELVDTIIRIRDMSRGGYETYNRNEEALARLLQKVLKITKDEKDWYLYFSALYAMISLYNHNFNRRMVVKYAELYYKESALHMDEILPVYRDTNLAEKNSWIYNCIYEAYSKYHQINDAKMDAFMKQYEETVVKYGSAYLYYKDEMELAALYRDVEMAEHGKKHFEEREEEMDGCYVCNHIPYYAYYLLTDKKQKAEELMLSLLHRSIPQKYQWCYQECKRAEPVALYAFLLHDCLLLGKTEYFRYFFRKYWMALPEKVPFRHAWSLVTCLCAIAGNFEDLEADLRSASESLKDAERESTVENMTTFLCWWCYFTLLDRSGVHEVEINIPELMSAEKNESGEIPAKISCLAIAEYYEKHADDYGMKFAKARCKFNYQSIKDTYRECAGL